MNTAKLNIRNLQFFSSIQSKWYQNKNETQYRKQILKEIKDYVAKQEYINDIIVAGDLNQLVDSNEIQQFYNNLGIQDAYYKYNNVEFYWMNPM